MEETNEEEEQREQERENGEVELKPNDMGRIIWKLYAVEASQNTYIYKVNSQYKRNKHVTKEIWSKLDISCYQMKFPTHTITKAFGYSPQTETRPYY